MKLSFFQFLLIFFPIVLVGQGYYNQENFGNRSILLSGNVTGSVEDLGLTYYNPARLALVEKPVFTINAKAYQYSSIKLKNVFGANEKLDDSNFNEVPSLVAGTFNVEKWKDQHFAYAFISKLRTGTNINAIQILESEDFEDIGLGLERFKAELNLDTRERDEWFGVSWSTKIKDNLSIGVSAFVSIYNFKNSFDLNYAALDDVGSVSFYQNQIKIGQSSYGMFWKVGLAWKLKKYDLGLNIDLPYLEVYKTGRFRFQEFLSGTEEDVFKFYDFRDIKSTRKEPLAISFGAGFPVGKHKIHFKVDWHGKLAEYNRLVIPPPDDLSQVFEFKEKRRSVINFGIGGEYYLSDKWSLYASLSTDFSPLRENANIFDLIGDNENDVNFDANYYHLGLGGDLKMKKVHLILGITYSTGTDKFDQPIDFPFSNANSSDTTPAEIVNSRWQFIVGLEIPIFGRDIEIK